MAPSLDNGTDGLGEREEKLRRWEIWRSGFSLIIRVEPKFWGVLRFVGLKGQLRGGGYKGLRNDLRGLFLWLTPEIWRNRPTLPR